MVAIGGSQTPRGLRKGGDDHADGHQCPRGVDCDQTEHFAEVMGCCDWSYESQLQRQVSVVVCVVHVHVWCMMSFIKLTNEANGTLGN